MLHELLYLKHDLVNTFGPGHVDWHFTNNILKCNFFRENGSILVSLTFPQEGGSGNGLVPRRWQTFAWTLDDSKISDALRR